MSSIIGDCVQYIEFSNYFQLLDLLIVHKNNFSGNFIKFKSMAPIFVMYATQHFFKNISEDLISYNLSL